MRSIQFEGVAQIDLQRNQIFLIDKCVSMTKFNAENRRQHMTTLNLGLIQDLGLSTPDWNFIILIIFVVNHFHSMWRFRSEEK